MTSRPASAQHLRDLALLRRVRDRIDREYARPLDVEALGTFAGINLATADLDGTFARLQAGDAEVVQEPIDQRSPRLRFPRSRGQPDPHPRTRLRRYS